MIEPSEVQTLEARFLRYVQIDTQSDETATSTPSTAKQYDLLRLLERELQAMGAQEVELTDYACLLATLPATVKTQAPTVAFLSHVDTAPAFSGSNVVPIVHRNYDGGEIVLPDDPSRVISPQTDPDLETKIGEDIITASGLTLLGADDKSGVAVMMTMAEHLLRHTEIPHGKIRLCFTPDEEIGKGVAYLTPEDLAADVAYTLDGGPVGEVTYETFSADKATVTITGVATHPGTAKGKLVNALLLAGKFITMLPAYTRTPETTEGREGFIHIYKMQGSAAEAEIQLILRDFEMEGLQAHGETVKAIAAAIRSIEPRARVKCTITPQYRNMRYWLEKDMRPVHLALSALRRQGIPPIVQPIRGGTDGSGLTAKGVPTPNLFVGMHNCHGPLEWVSLQDMVKATQVCIDLVQLWAEQTQSPPTVDWRP